MTSRARLVAVAVVRRPHGVTGEFSAQPLFEGEPSILIGTEVWAASSADELDGRSLRITHVRRHGERWLLRAEGFGTPESVREIAGRFLLVSEEGLPKSSEAEPYHFELVGCAVVDLEGRRLGTVRSIARMPGGDLLVLDDEARVLIPFRPMVVRVEREQRQVVVDLPEGLLDVNRRRGGAG